MSKKKSFIKKKHASGDVALQITSMADIFMILLVFLLKNYATSVSNVAPTARLSLPEINQAKGVIKETLTVEIASDTIMIDKKPVVNLRNFQFDADEEAGVSGSSPTITRILDGQRKMLPEPNTDSSLVILADQMAPYSTIKRVVASAAGAGFVNLQLVVVEND